MGIWLAADDKGRDGGMNGGKRKEGWREGGRGMEEEERGKRKEGLTISNPFKLWIVLDVV
jgi:hypothetical protein